jgi:hypothetical protein
MGEEPGVSVESASDWNYICVRSIGATTKVEGLPPSLAQTTTSNPPTGRCLGNCLFGHGPKRSGTPFDWLSVSSATSQTCQ